MVMGAGSRHGGRAALHIFYILSFCAIVRLSPKPTAIRIIALFASTR